VEVEPDGREGTIAAQLIPGGPVLTLQHRNRKIAETMRRSAELHKRRSGRPVRLVRYVRAETVEELP